MENTNLISKTFFSYSNLYEHRLIAEYLPKWNNIKRLVECLQVECLEWVVSQECNKKKMRRTN